MQSFKSERFRLRLVRAAKKVRKTKLDIRIGILNTETDWNTTKAITNKVEVKDAVMVVIDLFPTSYLSLRLRAKFSSDCFEDRLCISQNFTVSRLSI